VTFFYNPSQLSKDPANSSASTEEIEPTLLKDQILMNSEDASLHRRCDVKTSSLPVLHYEFAWLEAIELACKWNYENVL